MMAMAPWYERENLLHAALRKATLKVQRPIDRIEVTSDKILFWAGKVKLAITYTYVQVDSKIARPEHFLLDGEDFHDHQ